MIDQSQPAPNRQPAFQLTGELSRLLDGSLQVEDFIATVVHEAAQPLAAIQVLAAALIEAGDAMPLPERERMLGDIKDQAQFLRDLSVWTLNPFSRERVVFDRLIAEVAERCRPLAPDHVLVTAFDCGDAEISCETIRVEASVRNLIKNAIANSPAGSLIEIATSQADDHLIVSVSDTGSGIPESEWQRVFLPYVRLEGDRRPVSGIGLFIVKSCASQHQGFARVASSSRSGTTIELGLARSVDDRENAAEIAVVT